MLDAKDAKQQLENLILADASTRPYLESFWTLAAMYDSGKQWGYAHPSGPNVHIRQLRNVVDPRREDVRVVMDKTHEMTVQIRSQLKPGLIDVAMIPHSDAPSGRIVANAGQVFMEQLLRQIDALSLLRDRDNPRCVFGNAFIRRTLTSLGQAMEVDPEAGLRIRNFSIGWELVYPWEVLRDVAANSLRPYKDESIFCHAKPRSAAWVQRHFGHKPEDPIELGKLLGYHDQMRNASSISGGSSRESKVPSVMFYECYFRDPDSGGWDWCLMAYRTDSNPKSPLKLVPGGFFPNPFYGLPFEMFSYDAQAVAPWARGIPHLCMAGQQITNIAWTWLCRTMQAGAGKIMVEEGTVEDASKALDNRLDTPLVWKRPTSRPDLGSPPTRLTPPQISPAALQIIQAAPNWMSSALNLSDVQRGIVSKRGESGEAIDLRLKAANSSIEDIRTEDTQALNRLLYGTFVDAVRLSRLEQIEAITRGAIPPEHVMALKRQDPAEVIAGCQALSTMTRPTNPSEAKDTFVSLATANMMAAPDALWEMGVQGGVWPTTAMRDSRRKQQTEIEQLVAGQEVRPTIGDRHEYHIRTLQDYIDSVQWMTLPEDAQQRILEHWVLHQQAQAVLSGAGPQPNSSAAGQPSPSGEAVSAAVENAPGAMGPGLKIA